MYVLGIFWDMLGFEAGGSLQVNEPQCKFGVPPSSVDTNVYFPGARVSFNGRRSLSIGI